MKKRDDEEPRAAFSAAKVEALRAELAALEVELPQLFARVRRLERLLFHRPTPLRIKTRQRVSLRLRRSARRDRP